MNAVERYAAVEQLPATVDGRKRCRDCPRTALPDFTTCLAHLREATTVFAPAAPRTHVERLGESMPELQIAGRRS